MKRVQLFSFLLVLLLFSGCRKEGCTKENAYNYDADARKDDGTCRLTPRRGEEYGGGWCYYVGPAYEDYDHYLIAAKSDFTSLAQWGCSGTQIMSYSYASISRGPSNTIEITNECTEAWIAAKLCLDHVVGQYSDWELPSETELFMIASERSYVTGIVDGAYYWTSTEIDANNAVAILFTSGSTSIVTLPKTTLCRVRPTKYKYMAS